ncbi:MAG: M23 family metallopeptidase [Leptonema sp. (in: Bacteria)]|nr:M23 family metallopeptidase [Leptonema sp. (in: bacteria)]
MAKSRSNQPNPDLIRYLDDSDTQKRQSSDLLTRWRELRYYLHRKGKERITIMIVPHSESNILNLHISHYTLFATLGVLVVFLVGSLITIINRSAETVQFYDMGLTNSQFHIQSSRLAQEIIPLHERINLYTNTIASIHTRLSGRSDDLPPRGGVAEKVVENEINALSQLVTDCKAQGENCSQETIEAILRRSLYLSVLDNEKMKKAVSITDQIIKDLNTPEKQYLLKITPNIWPVSGAVAVPFQTQHDSFRGNSEPLRGVWFSASPNAEVVSTAPGTVTEVGYQKRFGLYMWVEHPIGIRTFYSHLERVSVSVGDSVKKGQVIGTVGRSGHIGSNMLYYEIHIGTVAYNPHAFLNHLQSLWLNPPNP